ncbi:MAG: glycoside hydrolase family 3 N-terminal domain-containing protein [Thermoanaerobaculales bacterium]|jgi:beta-N-acetylhexosaminidase|nr:glycoside hydrolase family 3 N-terminal domain-containing protein [Thermoanaerobaculales bacterium]
MPPECTPLVVGVPGPGLNSDEIRTLSYVKPCGVVLFQRNIETVKQARALVSELRELEPRPFVAVDLEGGAVNRLRPIWGELPSAAAAAATGRRAVRAVGEAAGAACRRLGIHLDLAPVVDLHRPNGMLAHQERCLAADPHRVTALARVFSEGLAAWGVSGCIKHFPGLGEIPVDTHDELPTLRMSQAELAAHLAVFDALTATVPLVMIGHVIVPALGEAELPASLSPTILQRARELPGSPVCLSDDLEMGALANSGDLPERVEAALLARNHGALVCSAFDRLEEIAARLAERTAVESSAGIRILEMAARMDALRRSLLSNAAAIPAPDDATVEQLWERARVASSMR